MSMSVCRFRPSAGCGVCGQVYDCSVVPDPADPACEIVDVEIGSGEEHQIGSFLRCDLATVVGEVEQSGRFEGRCPQRSGVSEPCL